MPILMPACARPEYLEKVLMQLSKCHGINEVFIERFIAIYIDSEWLGRVDVLILIFRQYW